MKKRSKQPRRRFERELKDSEIDFSDLPELTDSQLASMRVARAVRLRANTSPVVVKAHDDIDALRRRVELLERVCAEAYQFAGTVGAPIRVLDNLLAAAEGRELPRRSFLPVNVDECGAGTLTGTERQKIQAALRLIKRVKATGARRH